MCGIVGLFSKNPDFEASLGSHLTAMMAALCDRGPDSAGFAIYRRPVAGRTKLTVRPKGGFDLDAFVAGVGLPIEVERRHSSAVLSVPAAAAARVREAVDAAAPSGLEVVGEGTRMEIFKEVGLPTEVAQRFGLSAMSGTHGIGHTRMATESAVTTEGAHPFSTGPDQCLVHNGSLSNHNAVRRDLRRHGLRFATENDTEVAAAYLTWRMREGSSLGRALEQALDDLDGFYTFVVATESGFGVLRDPIACKPAVMAETDSYVAFASEYRALADLPDAETARVFEPEPAKVYFWDRRA